MMNNYKEIVTKAVVGKSKKSSVDNFTISCENVPNTVLGCWVINHKFNGTTSNEKVNVNGSYDVNVWYSYDNDTKTTVSKETFNYSETLTVNLKESVNDGKEVIVRSLKQPTVTNVKIVGDKVELSIDKELACEVVGNAKIKVPVEAIEDDYEDITNVNKEVDTDNIEVNEDYLN